MERKGEGRERETESMHSSKNGNVTVSTKSNVPTYIFLIVSFRIQLIKYQAESIPKGDRCLLSFSSNQS